VSARRTDFRRTFRRLIARLRKRKEPEGGSPLARGTPPDRLIAARRSPAVQLAKVDVLPSEKKQDSGLVEGSDDYASSN